MRRLLFIPRSATKIIIQNNVRDIFSDTRKDPLRGVGKLFGGIEIFRIEFVGIHTHCDGRKNKAD